MARKQHYVKITLQGEIVEDRPELPFFAYRQQIGFPWLLKLIETARLHKSVQAVLLVLKNVAIGWGEIQEIHQELDRFHAAGKRTLAYLEHADNKSYYLASGAQQVYVPPSATLDLVGLRAEVFFLKNLLEYLGVEPQLFSLGEYKSAAEIFTRENMSEPNRSMLDSILTDLQQQLATKVAARRSVGIQQVQAWIDRGPYTARQALENGLIDGIRYQDELEDLLHQQPPKLSELPASRLRVREGFLKRLFTIYRPQIAYVVAEGILTTGESRRRGGKRPIVGSETLIRFLRDARKRKRVKAVVIRVNSPGGSALASDLIQREIRITDQKKPVIVSFGDVAASGGYYLATAARCILGMPATLTGSIGVIHGKFNLHGLLSKVGVTVDWLDKGKRAGYLSATRAFSEEEAEIVQDQMREFYEELFLKKVAESRKKPLAEIRKVAEGRVWTGSQALSNKLLDQFGGVVEALEMAQTEAGLPKEKKVRMVRYLKRRTLRDLFPLPLSAALLDNHVLALMADEFDIR
ncbi:signal peptide peptidase SppA [Acidobacteria bacterium AH-259-A15]|nr:signal peptide peptidase SppA [Acidobacteria bacterium AH-259-A15]